MKGNCPRATCRSCPVCAAVLTVVMEPPRDSNDDDAQNLVGMYSCSYCRWTSEECKVMNQVQVNQETKKVDAESIVEATDMLLYEIESRVKEDGGGKDADNLFDCLVETWGKKAQEEERRKKGGGISLNKQQRRTTHLTIGGGGSGSKLWTLETLEDCTKAKQDKVKWSLEDAAMDKMSRLNFDSDEEEEEEEAEKKKDYINLTSEQVARQSVIVSSSSMAEPSGNVLLLPVPIQLRPRKSRRCRAELAAGRTGILVKPKLNPLEGDSSLRSGHGQWYKKDSSAIHVVPRVQVVKHGYQDGKYALLLMVKNPTLGTIRLRLNGIQNNSFLDPSELKNVIIDPMKRTRVNAEICSAASSLEPTEVMELDPVEDAFLELGKGQSRDPPEVEGWDPSSVLGSDRGNVGSTTSFSSAKVVATQNDKAWVDVVFAGNNAAVEEEESSIRMGGGKYLAAPIALQIEVGDGSWDSSLIKPLPVTEGERDFVTLNLVILWAGVE